MSQSHYIRQNGTLNSLFFITYAHTGSPLQFYVDTMNTGLVTAYGPGLCHGTVNKQATFTVITRNAGEGNQGTAIIKEPQSLTILYTGTLYLIFKPTTTLAL